MSGLRDKYMRNFLETDANAKNWLIGNSPEGEPYIPSYINFHANEDISSHYIF